MSNNNPTKAERRVQRLLRKLSTALREIHREDRISARYGPVCKGQVTRGAQ